MELIIKLMPISRWYIVSFYKTNIFSQALAKYTTCRDLQFNYPVYYAILLYSEIQYMRSM